MFNLVVLFTFVAAAAASGIVPLTYSAAILPATTTISRQASSVIHPTPLISTPLVYSSPLYSHFIKKRSAVFAPIIAPSTYIARTPYVTSYAAPLATTYSVAAPLTTAYASPFYGAHLIKKRSLAAVYAAPAAVYAAPAAVSHQSRVDIKSTPAVAYTSYSAPLAYAASPVISTPIVSAAPVVSAARFVAASPFAYSHLIKKRSAPLALATYVAPSAVSHQSRVDFKSTPAIATTYTSYAAPALTYTAPAVSYAAPISYSSPLISHLY